MIKSYTHQQRLKVISNITKDKPFLLSQVSLSNGRLYLGVLTLLLSFQIYNNMQQYNELCLTNNKNQESLYNDQNKKQ